MKKLAWLFVGLVGSMIVVSQAACSSDSSSSSSSSGSSSSSSGGLQRDCSAPPKTVPVKPEVACAIATASGPEAFPSFYNEPCTAVCNGVRCHLSTEYANVSADGGTDGGLDGGPSACPIATTATVDVICSADCD